MREKRALLQVLDTDVIQDGDGKLTREECNKGFDAVDTHGLYICTPIPAHAHAHAHAHARTHTHTNTHKHTQTHTNTQTHKHTHTHTHTHTHMYVCI